MDFFKFRIRFRKGGDLRFLSHHDLMRSFERMLRRANLPFRSTEGFHPHPRLVFALSLPLGVVGLDEVVELELLQDFAPDELLSCLAAQCPPGLELNSIHRISPRQTAQVSRAAYRLRLPSDCLPGIQAAISELLAQSEVWVERKHPQTKRVEIRQYLVGLRQTSNAVEMELRVTPTGSARAEEVLRLLGLADLLESGAVLERTGLELVDETIAAEGLAECAAAPLAAG